MPRRASRTAAGSTSATASPSRAPVRASTAPPGSTTLAEPRKRNGPHGPVWFADTTKTWFSTARARDQARDLGAGRIEPGGDVGRDLLRPGLADVAAERRLREHQQPRAALTRLVECPGDARQPALDVTVEGRGQGGDGERHARS